MDTSEASPDSTSEVSPDSTSEAGTSEASPDSTSGQSTSIAGTASVDFADKATLEFFSNPAYLNLLAKRTQRKNTAEDNDDEIKFYKKRILSLFKDMLKGTEPSSNMLQEYHTTFTRAAINYFKIVDRQDIIQEQYAQAQQSEAHTQPAPAHVSQAHDIDQANEYMMRKTINVSNLDNYVMSTKSSDNSLRVIPLKLEIDLKAPHLKTKGVKPKTKDKKILVYNTNDEQAKDQDQGPKDQDQGQDPKGQQGQKDQSPKGQQGQQGQQGQKDQQGPNQDTNGGPGG